MRQGEKSGVNKESSLGMQLAELSECIFNKWRRTRKNWVGVIAAK